ncbi:N-substituted formamide deformylase [bioreactor metagenome]|uniref:N-substituted formamide deformylase n=1 Tax=bioreactor metagenome TaxID=1076179 RepID=A0A645GKW5_9ZZZZ
MANQQGLQIYVHSTGDASTKKVLDILESIQDRVPSGDYRNTITHLQLVDQGDVPRFKKLQVIASVQPYWHFKGPNWWESVDYRILGERAKTEYPLGTFFAYGVTVTSSSDYPVTNVPYPMRAIDVGVTRNMDNGSFYGVDDIKTMDDERYLLNANERATVQQMLKSFTINGAYAMFLEEDIGSIEVGKLADLVVLDQNLLAINPNDIDKVQVEMTFIDGKLVYKQKKQA